MLTRMLFHLFQEFHGEEVLRQLARWRWNAFLPTKRTGQERSQLSAVSPRLDAAEAERVTARHHPRVLVHLVTYRTLHDAVEVHRRRHFDPASAEPKQHNLTV